MSVKEMRDVIVLIVSAETVKSDQRLSRNVALWVVTYSK